MKKKLKILIVVISFIIVIILFDTVQASIFKKSPFISWREKVENNDSYIDKGIIMDTYYCGKEKKNIEINWKLKFSSYKCPANSKNAKYVGKWIANGTQYKTIVSVDSNGQSIYADDYDKPYYLLVNNDSTYLLKLNDKSNTEESGTYQIENTQIIFSPNNNNFVWYCQLEKETLNCNSYAEKFEK